MNQEEKKQYLDGAKKVLDRKRSAIKKEIEIVPQEALKLRELLHGSQSDIINYYAMTAIYRKRYNDLLNLHPSPYFNFCLVKFEGEDNFKELYFSKFSFDAQEIYSWASPIAQIRFENPGKFIFKNKNGNQTIEIIKKDQYLIAEGKILFLSTESNDQERELVYQEYFSTRKTAFILPEIVAQMEKAQDQVVRAQFGGKLAVTGPAGSGKTTLALHRIAYLLQAPETSDKLDSRDVIVFVQDESTRDYFSHLLPELGIKDVEITTLGSWAKKILPIENWNIEEFQKDSDAHYVWAKIQAQKTSKVVFWKNDWFSILTETYGGKLNQAQKKMLMDQKKKKILDRVDLAILLKSKIKTDEGINVEKEYYQVISKTQELKKKKKKFKVSYKLILIDEFQNYLSEHIEIFNQGINPSGGELIFIGDFNQRVRLGTVNNMLQIDLQEERLVKLSKVYRNTKQILMYLNELGYKVDIPQMIKDGPKVQEAVFGGEEEEKFIQEKLKELDKVSVGILSHDELLLKNYAQKFDQGNVKVMSLIDAQGVEFDTVFLVGVGENLLSVKHLPVELQEEMAKIKRDLLYIALTRAMNELYVIGEKKLSDIVSK